MVLSTAAKRIRDLGRARSAAKAAGQPLPRTLTTKPIFSRTSSVARSGPTPSIPNSLVTVIEAQGGIGAVRNVPLLPRTVPAASAVAGILPLGGFLAGVRSAATKVRFLKFARGASIFGAATLFGPTIFRAGKNLFQKIKTRQIRKGTALREEGLSSIAESQISKEKEDLLNQTILERLGIGVDPNEQAIQDALRNQAFFDLNSQFSDLVRGSNIPFPGAPSLTLPTSGDLSGIQTPFGFLQGLASPKSSAPSLVPAAVGVGAILLLALFAGER